MKIADLLKALETATEEEKAQVRDALGIKLTASKAVSGTRVTGKVQRSEKVLEEKVAKQMQILIGVLPVDRAIDINEWADLAVAAGLATQQPPVRIAAYYKKPIVDGGYAICA